MRVQTVGGLDLWRFTSFASDRLDAFVSTRKGGVSSNGYASLNLGLRTDDRPEDVTENRKRLFDAAGLDLARSVWCRQVHENAVKVVEGRDAGRGSTTEQDIVADCDALITAQVDLVLCVTLADCVPVVIYDPERHVLGLAHAGWRGTVKGVAGTTVAVMTERFGCRPEALQAAIGPSIAVDDYEVGDDVADFVREAFGAQADEVLRTPAEAKPHFDLWRSNRLVLQAAGVLDEHIEVAGVSTAAHLEDFYSHRLEGPHTGRFIAAASLRRLG